MNRVGGNKDTHLDLRTPKGVYLYFRSLTPPAGRFKVSRRFLLTVESFPLLTLSLFFSCNLPKSENKDEAPVVIRAAWSSNFLLLDNFSVFKTRHCLQIELNIKKKIIAIVLIIPRFVVKRYSKTYLPDNDNTFTKTRFPYFLSLIHI